MSCTNINVSQANKRYGNYSCKILNCKNMQKYKIKNYFFHILQRKNFRKGLKKLKILLKRGLRALIRESRMQQKRVKNVKTSRTQPYKRQRKRAQRNITILKFRAMNCDYLGIYNTIYHTSSRALNLELYTEKNS